MRLSDEQISEDRAFCSEVWELWKEYGGGCDSDPNYWENLVEKMSAVAKTELQIKIAMAILEECKRRSK